MLSAVIVTWRKNIKVYKGEGGRRKRIRGENGGVGGGVIKVGSLDTGHRTIEHRLTNLLFSIVLSSVV